MSKKLEDIMDEKIRVYAVPERGKRNYYCFMTTLGPAFGGTEENAAILKLHEFLEATRVWPEYVLWRIEPVDNAVLKVKE